MNAPGTRIVLEAGLAAGCNPVVHVSSVMALIGGTRRGAIISADSPPGAPVGVYAKSKRDSDLIARGLQAQGHPVVITYPGGVWGPEDPYLGESSTMALQMARGLVPLTSMGRFGVVDVRDVAAVHAALMKRHDHPARYPAFGNSIRHCDLHRMVCDAAGVRRLNLPSPALVAYCSIPMFQLIAVAGVHWAHTPDGAYLTWCNHPVDNGASERELGVTFRPTEESVRDTVAWLKKAGHLRA